MTVMENYKEVRIPLGDLHLKGNLRLSELDKGIVIFSHGSGSSRMSYRNNFVADILLNQGFSSLLFDLLTEEEDMIFDNRFNIDLLTQRLIDVTRWIREDETTKNLPIGYFGASTGAASALFAAVKLPEIVRAVVSRGGRPDLAMEILQYITIPTLLMVGSQDRIVINLNKKAQENIHSICELQIIDGASHLFPEPGKLEEVAKSTYDWFDMFLT